MPLRGVKRNKSYTRRVITAKQFTLKGFILKMLKSAKAEKKWLVVKTKPNAEKKVAERLALKELEVYLPLYTTVKQWSDRKKKVQKP